MWIPEIGGKTELVSKLFLCEHPSIQVKNMDQATRLKDVVLTKEKIKTIKNN